MDQDEHDRHFSLGDECDKTRPDSEESCDSDTSWREDMDRIMAHVDAELVPELVEFYTEFFADPVSAEQFVKKALRRGETNIPRQMANHIHRLITLSDDMEQIRPGEDCLKLFFIITCIDAEYGLESIRQKSCDPVIDFFTYVICDEDKKIIRSKILRSLGDDLFEPQRRAGESQEDCVRRRTTRKVDIEAFARIVKEIRNLFAHEGTYWKFSFSDDGSPKMNILDVKEISGAGSKEERCYDVMLTYQEFRSICVRADPLH